MKIMHYISTFYKYKTIITRNNLISFKKISPHTHNGRLICFIDGEQPEVHHDNATNASPQHQEKQPVKTARFFTSMLLYFSQFHRHWWLNITIACHFDCWGIQTNLAPFFHLCPHIHLYFFLLWFLFLLPVLSVPQPIKQRRLSARLHTEVMKVCDGDS